MSAEQGEGRPETNGAATLNKIPDTQYSTALDAARWAAALGAPVFPLKPGAKAPAGGHGFKDATTDTAQIERWAAQFPGCNWGMANGHRFDVIDLDGDKGLASALEYFGGNMPDALGWVSTPGGMHGYVPVTERKRRTGALPGVDLLGAGGYVVLPGSVLADERRYTWASDMQPDAQLDMAPWLALWDTGKAPETPTPSAAVVASPTDPTRARAMAAATLEGIAKDLTAAQDWADGDTDGHGRGWEKLVADAALRVGQLARTEHTGVTMDTGLDVLRSIVPDVMALEVGLDEKWRQQSTRGEPFALPSLFGSMGLTEPEARPVAPSAVGNIAEVGRDVVGMLHGQTQFAYGLGIEGSDRHMYVHGMGWHHFDGKSWREDEKGKVYQALRRLLERTAAKNIDSRDVLAQVRAATSASAQEGILKIARTMPEFARVPDELDADPNLLNVANGTLDLNTFELRPHDPADAITKVCRAAWTPETNWRASRWASFLTEVLPDEGVRSYLQRYVGTALLGEVLEHTLAVLTGTGRNGKGVAYGSISWALGDYAASAEPDLFMHREGAHPTGQMDLLGRRWVVVSESESGRRLADATVKRLTGGDAIRARRMGQDFTEFEPSHTAALVTNHLPRVSADDPAMWSRLRVVPFDVVVPEGARDKHLKATMRGEADAVLAWAVEGLQEYRRIGMAEPAAVLAATEAYRESNDKLAEFLEDNTRACTKVKDYATVTELHTRYTTWCTSQKLEAEGRKTFTETLERRGFQTALTKAGTCWRGVELTGFQVRHALSEAKGGEGGVSPAPPTNFTTRERVSETPLSPPFTSGSTQNEAQRAIFAQLTGTTNTNNPEETS